MVRLRHVTTGQIVHRWPVDARGMIACGEYTADTPSEAHGPAAAVTPPDQALGADDLGEKSYRELQQMAKSAGLNAGQKHEDLLAAIREHVAAGTVSTDRPAPLTLPNATLPHVEA